MTKLLLGASSSNNNDINTDNQEELLNYLDSDLSISFQEYQIQQQKLSYLSKCPVFDNMSKGDCQRLAESMELVTVNEGETIIEEGSTTGDSMYFLIIDGDDDEGNGKLECVDKNNTLLTTYDKDGQYFGEVSLLFGEPRQATIRALQDNTRLYRLDKAAFRESMVDSKVFDTARDMILKKYAGNRLRDVVLTLKLSSGEIIDLLTAKLQPQKKIVSLESQIRLFTWGAATSLLVAALSPTIGSNGMVSGNLYDLSNPLPKGSVVLVSSLFVTLSFITTSSDTQKTISTFSNKLAIEWLSVGFWLAGLSNLTGGVSSMIDAWGVIPKFVLILSLLGSIRTSIETIALMGANTRRNNDANPDGSPRTKKKAKGNSLLLTAATLGLANLGLLTLLFPTFSSFDHFRLYTLPKLAADKLPGLVPYLCIVAQCLLSFVSPGVTRKWMVLATPFIAFDAVKFGIQSLLKMCMSPPNSHLLSFGKQWQTVVPIIVAAWSIGGKLQSIRIKTTASSQQKGGDA